MRLMIGLQQRNRVGSTVLIEERSTVLIEESGRDEEGFAIHNPMVS